MKPQDDPMAARLSVVLRSLEESRLPGPIVEDIAMATPDAARVRLRGVNGVRATVRLQREGGQWRVASVEAA